MPETLASAATDQPTALAWWPPAALRASTAGARTYFYFFWNARPNLALRSVAISDSQGNDARSLNAIALSRPSLTRSPDIEEGCLQSFRQFILAFSFHPLHARMKECKSEKRKVTTLVESGGVSQPLKSTTLRRDMLCVSMH
ncbi:hypothetical protein HaLaN_06197 [Haematococcus lacustris]|uniref:Uncharacterized protein n=1 Tax=Haematococcus lacustris TaxID=44745 RepID=A0A699Z5U1_HAELA|nr:hypothetical protein HaLaN_06197 [Haematococcus lacustris]